MRKAKKHLNFPVELLTPEEKLEQISLLEDDKYNFIPLTARQSKINGWITEQNIFASRDSDKISSLQNSIILGKAISPAKEKVNSLSKNKNLLALQNKIHDQIPNIRPKSVEITLRKPFKQNLKDKPLQLSKIGGMKLPFGYLRKNSRENLYLKNKGKEKGRLSIQSISYPIFESKQIQANPQREYNPVFGKIRLLLQHRKNLSTQL